VTITLSSSAVGVTHTATALSHLQFEDDTLLLGTKSWENFRAFREILTLFEVMYGFEVNYHKSMLVGINVDESWLS